MKPIRLTEKQQAAADNLNEGIVIFAYRDDQSIRMETARGSDPYVWRDDRWVKMRRK